MQNSAILRGNAVQQRLAIQRGLHPVAVHNAPPMLYRNAQRYSGVLRPVASTQCDRNIAMYCQQLQAHNADAIQRCFAPSCRTKIGYNAPPILHKKTPKFCNRILVFFCKNALKVYPPSPLFMQYGGFFLSLCNIKRFLFFNKCLSHRYYIDVKRG